MEPLNNFLIVSHTEPVIHGSFVSLDRLQSKLQLNSNVYNKYFGKQMIN